MQLQELTGAAEAGACSGGQAAGLSVVQSYGRLVCRAAKLQLQSEVLELRSGWALYLGSSCLLSKHPKVLSVGKSRSCQQSRRILLAGLWRSRVSRQQVLLPAVLRDLSESPNVNRGPSGSLHC